ncbi:VOC family protein [Pontibacillus salipaludis]|uniref:VOC family protein n=1 Tax=Pontibacillus salipaludis TaxID=1697394 RepID=UPI0031F1B773
MNIKGFVGVFWRTKKLESLKKWYSDVLKIELEDWNGTVLIPQPGNETVFSFFSESDTYFPEDQQVMLNFQVDNIDESIKHLQQIGITLVMEKTVNQYGKFIWIEDPEGRRIELWEK